MDQERLTKAFFCDNFLDPKFVVLDNNACGTYAAEVTMTRFVLIHLCLLAFAGCDDFDTFYGGGAPDGSRPPDLLLATGPDLAMNTPKDAAVDLAQAPTCHDSITNGAETDVDCGGDSCPPCTRYPYNCRIDRDCDHAKGLKCVGGICGYNVKLLDSTGLKKPGPDCRGVRWVDQDGNQFGSDFEAMVGVQFLGPTLEVWGNICLSDFAGGKADGSNVTPTSCAGTSCGPAPGGEIFNPQGQSLGFGCNAACTQK
jgi:hypothetical protein